MQKQELIINGNDLTIDKIVKVAFSPDIFVKISPGAKEKIQASRKVVDDLVARGEVVYGLTTGFGEFRNKSINFQQAEELQNNLIRSHAIGVGRPFSLSETRTAILIRANSLTKGYSGVRLIFIEKLLELLNKNIYPYIPCQGSVGASGDLAPLSHLGLVMMGEGEVIENQKRVATPNIFEKYNFQPIKFSYKEGLALNNGTSFMTALAVLNLKRAKNIIKWSDRILATSLEALQGTLVAYEERVHKLRPHPGQIKTAFNVRSLCQNSQIVGPGNNYPDVQDSYSLRCSPQVHGAVKDSFEYAKKIVEIEINSVTDNPLIFSDTGEAVSAGHFHGEPIAFAMENLGIAIAELGTISERRTAKMLDPSTNDGLPAFLIPKQKGGLCNGYMIAQYTAAALVAENKVLSHPAAVDSIPTSANQEDHVSFAPISARKCKKIINHVENILAIELMCAVQGIDFRRPAKPGFGVQQIYAKIRTQIPFLDNDRILYTDLEKVVKIIRSN
ncbi:histidine ammonia-lyase [Candidatus Parcubacteria bacterium]|nr:histidine ammonia-lyase [Patescibacteria group bacterium]MBU4482417.1 histidine ammonia-lyase [Patescibacteria group bacterium]MCG2686626.1 histidine ammonia-lyase [Candidatus Parcubacteria bacterium]